MARSISPETKARLEMYLTGEMQQKIKLIKSKIDKGLPRELYNTYTAVDLSKPYSGNTNTYSDRTGSRATKLADLSLERERTYLRYLTMQKTIKQVLEGFPGKDIYLLKARLDLIDNSITAACRKVGVPKYKAKKRVEKLINILDKKITAALIKLD